MRALLRKILPNKWHSNQILKNRVLKICNRKVFSGPFQGMNYVGSSFGSVYFPKLLGTYELELAPYIQKIIRFQSDCIIVAGAAEGYYCVGLAMKNPDANVVAYEANTSAHQVINHLAEINNVQSQIEIKGVLEISALKYKLASAQKPIIFMDIEGGEVLALDPLIVPELYNSIILVEFHDFLIPEVSQIIRQRFEQTHECIEIKARERTKNDFPLDFNRGKKLLNGAIIQILSEMRPAGMSWGWFIPKS